MNARNLFFPHDASASRDEKLLALRLKLNWAGYGLYFAILERLFLNDGKCIVNYELLAYDLRADAGTIKQIINDFGLFVVDSDYFYSERLLDHISKMQEKSEKAANSVRKRWEKANERNTNVLQSNNKRNTNKIIKDNIKKEDNNTLSLAKDLEDKFKLFYEKYQGTKRGVTFELKNFKSKHKNWKEIVPLLEPALDQLITWHDKKIELGQFVPEYASLTKWINESRWEDKLQKITVKPVNYGNNQQPTTELQNESFTNGGRTDTL